MLNCAALGLITLMCIAAISIVLIELLALKPPRNLPAVGFQGSILYRCRASFRQILDGTRPLRDGYKEYGRNGLPFVVPDTTLRPQVMLPPEHIRWLITQPESVLSLEAVRLERNGVRYLPTNLDPKSTLLFIDKVIGKSLNKDLDIILADIQDEVRDSVDLVLGMDTEVWREVSITQAMSSVVDRTSSRVLFGTALSRNAMYLRAMRCFITLMGITTLIVGQLPPIILRPLIGWSLMFPTYLCKRWVVSHVRPVVRDHLDAVTSQADKHPRDQQNDFVSQSVQIVRRLRSEVQGNVVDFLVEQFLFLAFAGMATTGAAATNLMLDVLARDEQNSLYAGLRVEAEDLFADGLVVTSNSVLKDMRFFDGVIKQSLRRNTMQSRGLLRKVTLPEGVILPSGEYVPNGTWIGIPVEAMHGDERFHPHSCSSDQEGCIARKHKNFASSTLDAAYPTDKYVPFSLGRSTCPGRFFAVAMLKLMMAYITMHYDIRPLLKRPPNLSFGDASIPPFNTTMKIRRREQTL